MRNAAPNLDFDKLANTVLYLLEGCGYARPSLTALLKMLWFADYEHYRRHLRSITGGQYVALERGPVLDRYKEVFEALEEHGVVERREVPIQGQKEKKVEFIPQAEANEAVFAESELEVLAEVVQRHAGKTGAALSDKTHFEGPWLFVWRPSQPGRHIPFILWRWLDNIPDEADLARARHALSRPPLVDRIKALNQQRAN